MSRDRIDFVTARPGRSAYRILTLTPDTLAGLLEHLLEKIAEALRRPAVGVQPHRGQKLPSRALVLDARLEPGEEPSIDVVKAHHPKCRQVHVAR